jgi:hypothetical protein
MSKIFFFQLFDGPFYRGLHLVEIRGPIRVRSAGQNEVTAGTVVGGEIAAMDHAFLEGAGIYAERRIFNHGAGFI